MSSSVDSWGEKLENLRRDSRRGKWSEVIEVYKQESVLRTAPVTATGDTVLHMAVSNRKEKVVATMVDLVLGDTMDRDDGEESWNVNVVLGAENDRKNTPLHLAATIGNVKMCKKICRAQHSLIIRRNIAGETPLFLAALYGKREAFLWLHYIYTDSPHISSIRNDEAPYKRDNYDTILHCAMAQGHIDVAIEIIHLYKDHMKEMMIRNKEGLSPLHLLASKPSAFKSSGFVERSILSHSIPWIFSGKKKKHATTKDELEQRDLETFYNKCLRTCHKIKMNVLHQDVFYEDMPQIISRTAFEQLSISLQTTEDNENQGTFFVNFIKFTSWLLRWFLELWLFQLIKIVIWFSEMSKTKREHTWSIQIMNELLQHASHEQMSQIVSRSASEQLSISSQMEEDDGYESMAASVSGRITVETPLMIGTKNGVVEMVEKILELFPSRIRDVNAEGKNIILLAVEYRQTKVYRFLCKQKWLSESVFRKVDDDGNNALHLAARLGVEPDWLNPGEVLSMSREINWFKFVKNSMPHGLLERYNKKMEKPDDIFKESHKELLKSEGEWVAKTSQACSVVSTLVLSVAAASRTSVPGGYDPKGYAILRNKLAFKYFSISSLLAVFFSLVSTIYFLSIAVSRSQSVHSWRYVPLKLYFAMGFMFLSIACLWVSFCTGHFFMLDDSEKARKALGLYISMSLMIVLIVVTQLLTFLGLTLSGFRPIPTPRRKATCPIEFRSTKNEENGASLNPKN